MKLRVLVLTHQDVALPASVRGLSNKDRAPWKTEYDVVSALRALGHEAQILGGVDELATIRRAFHGWKPSVVFNLLEEFRGEGIYVPYILGYCALTHHPFTGCNPTSLLLTDNKALTKKILRYHRVPVPAFALYPRGRAVRRPRSLSFPLIVKSNTAHGSVGIAQASVVRDDDELAERVRLVHEKTETDAIAEEYVEGRELYVAMLGNRRLETFPIWELDFDNLPERAPRIATERVKWDLDYQRQWRIRTAAAKNLPEGADEHIRRVCKRVYRILDMNGYARMDIRLTDAGKIYLLEPNPNPDLARDEDFARAAALSDVSYERLIQRILKLGVRYHS